MTKKLRSRFTKISLIIAGMAVLATMTFNCSPALFEAKKGSGGSSLGVFSVFEATNAPITLLTAEQTFQSMLNVTGQTTGTMVPAVRTEYNARFGSMSSTANLGNVNSPLMLASTSLAGDVCDSLMTGTNKPTAAYFNDSLAGPPDFNKVTASASYMAQAFYGRPLSGDELNNIRAYYDEMTTESGVALNAALSKQINLGLCAAMLSSFDSLVY